MMTTGPLLARRTIFAACGALAACATLALFAGCGHCDPKSESCCHASFSSASGSNANTSDLYASNATLVGGVISADDGSRSLSGTLGSATPSPGPVALQPSPGPMEASLEYGERTGIADGENHWSLSGTLTIDSVSSTLVTLHASNAQAAPGDGSHYNDAKGTFTVDVSCGFQNPQ